MVSKKYKYEPDYAVCPGETIRGAITALGITHKEFALRLGVSEKHLVSLLKGATALTNEMFIKLENATGTPARIWNALEMRYQEQLLKIQLDEQFQRHQSWVDALPFNELAKRGYVSPTRDKREKYSSALKFFGVATYDAWVNSRCAAAFRKGATFKTDSLKQNCALEAWLRLVELQALTVEVSEYDSAQFEKAIIEIRKLTQKEPKEFISQIKKLCARAGVIFILEPEIPGASVNGALRWIHQNKTPVICLNLRGKYNDIFWFTFFHEAGHLLKGKKELFIDTPKQDDSAEENKANIFALNILFPDKSIKELVQIQSKEDVMALSKKIRLHPGCIAGQMAHRGLIPYNSSLLSLREKYAWVTQDEK